MMTLKQNCCLSFLTMSTLFEWYLQFSNGSVLSPYVIPALLHRRNIASSVNTKFSDLRNKQISELDKYFGNRNSMLLWLHLWSPHILNPFFGIGYNLRSIISLMFSLVYLCIPFIHHTQTMYLFTSLKFFSGLTFHVFTSVMLCR